MITDLKEETMADQQAILHQGVPCYSFRQLDEQAGVAKGNAFRAFKRAREQLVEGVDYFYLQAEQEWELIEQLRSKELIYRSTRHLVLLTEAGREKVF